MQRSIAARAAVLSLCLLALSGAAHAQLFRAYVSSTGSDANPCTIVAPCRLLPAALTAVATGGEIWMLDSANFNTSTVTVAKSVSILTVPGAVGSVVGVGGATALVINGSTTKVTLRNLRIAQIAGAPPANGVIVGGGAKVTIEGGTVAGFETGIRVTEEADLQMVDGTSRDNLIGVEVRDGGRASLSRVLLTRNVQGAAALATLAGVRTVRLDIADSTISYNTTLGVIALATVAATAYVTVRSCQVTNNADFGLIAGSHPTGQTRMAAYNNTISGHNAGLQTEATNARLYAVSNLVFGNTFGMANLAGAIESSGNILRDNLTPTSGVIVTF